jgi:hypothetical protein
MVLFKRSIEHQNRSEGGQRFRIQIADEMECTAEKYTSSLDAHQHFMTSRLPLFRTGFADVDALKLIKQRICNL